MQPIHHINFDINLLGDSDVVVAELARRAGWDLKHKMIPEGQQAEVVTVDNYEHTYRVKISSAVQTTTNGVMTEGAQEKLS